MSTSHLEKLGFYKHEKQKKKTWHPLLSTGSTAPCGVLHTFRHSHDLSCGVCFGTLNATTSSNAGGFDGRLHTCRKAAHSVSPCSEAVGFHYPTPLHRRRYLPMPYLAVSTRTYKQRFIIACPVSYLFISRNLDNCMSLQKRPLGTLKPRCFFRTSTTHTSINSISTVAVK